MSPLQAPKDPFGDDFRKDRLVTSRSEEIRAADPAEIEPEKTEGEPVAPSGGAGGDLGDDLPWAPEPSWVRGGGRSGEGDPEGEGAAKPHLQLVPTSTPLPFWENALDQLKHNRRTQVLAGALGLVVVLAVAFWPRGAPVASVGSLRRHPERFENQEVVVRGRVVETFQMGGGCAFNLVQGRDTLVVFSRFRTPLVGERLEVKGTLQPGSDDGSTRLALFESPS
jgi:hypothetical protein